MKVTFRYWWLLKYVLNVSFNSVVCNFPRDGDDDLALQCKGSAYFWIYIDTEARTFNSIESYQAFAESTRPVVNINSGVRGAFGCSGELNHHHCVERWKFSKSIMYNLNIENVMLSKSLRALLPDPFSQPSIFYYKTFMMRPYDK